MQNLCSEIIRRILEVWVLVVLVVSGIVFALIFLSIWLMGYTVTALLIVIMVLVMTTPDQREKNIHAFQNWFKSAVGIQG